MKPESTWTKPSVFCPKPHHWHAQDSMSTEAEVGDGVAGLVRLLQPDLVVETGSGWGTTTKKIGEVLKKNGHGRLIALDINLEFVDSTAELCKGLPVEPLYADCNIWEPPAPIDFLFLDAEEPGHRPQQFARLRPHLARGSVAVFHDAAPHHGLLPGLEALQAQGLIKRFVVLRNPRGLCVAEVD